MSFTKPTLLQALLITIGAAVFAFFSCVGAIAGFSSSGQNASLGGLLGWAAGLVFFVSMLVFFFGGLMLIIRVFSAIFSKRDGAR